MKKFLLLFALCGLFSFQAKAEGEVTDNYIISETDKISVGELKKTTAAKPKTYFDVSLEGSDVYYTAYQAVLELPEGLTVSLKSDGNPNVSLRKTTNSPQAINQLVIDEETGEEIIVTSYPHEIVCTYVETERLLKILVSSMGNHVFSKTSGELFRVFVEVSPYMQPGEAQIKTSDVYFTKNDGTMYKLPSESYPINIANTREISLNISATQQWNTCVLPFDAELPEGVRAFEGSSISGDYLILSEATSLQAFTPYILYAENGYEGTLNGTVDAEKYVTAATGAYLNGAIMPQEITEGYVMQDKGQGDGMMFYNVNNRSFTIPSGKCWVSAAAGDAKAIRIGLGGTGIESLPSASQTEEGEVYTLDGKRVQNPQKGNVYIKGGKKVLYLK